MRIKIIFLTAFFVVAGRLSAQDVEITGHVAGFGPQSLIRVQVYADQFSQLEKTLAATHADIHGNFRLTFPVKQTTYVMLYVNLKHTGFYLKPGGIYHLNIKQDSAARFASPFEEIPLRVQMHAKDDSLNTEIVAYDRLYSRLIINHFRDIYQFHDWQPVENFEDTVRRRFGKTRSAYLQQYIHYSEASLVWGSRTKSLHEIVASYFAGHPVLYRNVQYTNLFLDFFRAYFESTVKRPVTKDRLQQIVPLRNLKMLDNLFAEDPALSADARVRQLTEMVQLAKYFPDHDFSHADINALFKQIAATSPYPENRLVAKDYLKRLNILQPGTPAPSFVLPDFMGKEYALKDFRGKFVLLSFVNTHCPVCNYQINKLKGISQSLDENFTNLTIVVGKVTRNFMQEVQPTHRRWPFLLLGRNILLLEKYQIVTYPSYVLINPQGRILMAPAPMPGQSLGQRIAIWMRAYKKHEQN